MAHNLNFNEKANEYACFTNKPAWHGLSQVVEGCLTAEEAIRKAHLDYIIEKQQIFTKKDEVYSPLGKNFVTVRQDTGDVLGLVGSKYTVLQNIDAFKFFDTVIGNSEAKFESAGALHKGQKVFITAKIPDKIVVGNDVADCYFFIYNSHDGSSPVTIAFSETYILCENTLRQAMRSQKRGQRIKHTSNIFNNMLDATELMGITRAKIVEKQEFYTALTKVNLNDEQIKKLIKMAMYPQMEQISEDEYSKRFENILDSAFEYITTNSSQLGVERNHTLWGFAQGINGIGNHRRYKSEDDKLNSIMFGTGYNQTANAFSLAYDILQNPNLLN